MSLMDITFYSESLRRDTGFYLILPDDGTTKTLFLLHGYSGCKEDWLTKGLAVNLSDKYKLAVILPSAENKFYTDARGIGNAHGQYIGKDIMEYVRKTFGLAKKREDTFIGGLSMGGFGALRNALKYNGHFSKVFALSAALIVNSIKNMKEDEHTQLADYYFYTSVFGDLTKLDDSDSNPEYLLKSIMERGEKLPEMYMACGKGDSLIDTNREFMEFLKCNGVLAQYIEDEGVHDWDYWNSHLEPAIRWLLD